jgi:glycolate oxidase subunit GlcD
MAASSTPQAIESGLEELLGTELVLPGTTSAYLTDATETRGIYGHADAVCITETAEQVAAVISWCYERGVPIVPRGGGTGYAGGAVPVNGGVVMSMERQARIRSFEPLFWRMEAEAGLRTVEVQRIARESGLYFPPDPGAAEQSQIGGNVATNAGGPHSFKYGTTGAWVTGLEAVVPPGEIVSFGGPIRKDAASYQLKSLLIGSEGTLGVITSVWLRLLPAPEAALPIVAFYAGVAGGCKAVEAIIGSGLGVAALEFLDSGTVTAAHMSLPGGFPDSPRFMVIAEADGSTEEATRLRADVIEALSEKAESIHAPMTSLEIAALWRWRSSVSFAVIAQRGGKVSEDIVVPVDRLAEAIERSIEIGKANNLATCSWGHAGDGNLHSTFMVDPSDDAEIARAVRAAEELFALAVELGGSISGEHGIGWAKRGQLDRQLSPRVLGLHDGVKAMFDPRGLMNPGKKR